MLTQWEKIYSVNLPAVQQSTTDKPVSLSDIYSLIYYVGVGLCATFLLLFGEICFYRVSNATK